MIIKDAMVVIHLAKITLLEKSCEYFKKVIIPKKVYDEIILGKEKGYAEVNIFEELITNNKLKIAEIENENLLKKTDELNIQGGEAEAIILYWENKAQFLATDDDNVRKKAKILELNVIGTPSIIVQLYREKKINKEKFIISIEKLKNIGWFSNTIIDKILMEEK